MYPPKTSVKRLPESRRCSRNTTSVKGVELNHHHQCQDASAERLLVSRSFSKLQSVSRGFSRTIASAKTLQYNDYFVVKLQYSNYQCQNAPVDTVGVKNLQWGHCQCQELSIERPPVLRATASAKKFQKNDHQC